MGVKFPGRWRSLLSGAMHTRNWSWHTVNLGCPLPVSNKFQCIGNDVSDIWFHFLYKYNVIGNLTFNWHRCWAICREPTSSQLTNGAALWYFMGITTSNPCLTCQPFAQLVSFGLQFGSPSVSNILNETIRCFMTILWIVSCKKEFFMTLP